MPNVHVPRVLPELSGRHVLTMELVNGVKLSDADGITALRLWPAEVASLLTAAFSVMVFSEGFVHCDPHPGNLLVRAQPQTDDRTEPPGHAVRPQLVLLDHGLYRELGSEFRVQYCRLWDALLTQDHRRGRAAAQSLGVRLEDYDSLSLLLTFRTSASRTAIGTRGSAEERDRVRQKLRQLSVADVSSFLERMPRDMLFVMRTWALVRSLNRALGGTTRQRLEIMGGYAARGVAVAMGGRSSPPWRVTWRIWWGVLRSRIYLVAFNWAFRLLRSAHGKQRSITKPSTSSDLG